MATAIRHLVTITLCVVVIGVAFLVTTPAASAAPALQLPWPTGEQHRINGGWTYGCPKIPFDGTHDDMTAPVGLPYGAGYYAIDFQSGPADGSPLNVSAVAGGTIVYRDNALDGYGWKVVVDHNDGQSGTHYYSVYAHFRDPSDGATWGPGIVQNGKVGQGRLLGYAGDSGGDYPVHLHTHMQYGSSAYKAEPMSGISDFGLYGYSLESGLNPPSKGCSDSGSGCTQSICGNINDPSPYWKSLPSFNRDFGTDTCSDVMARSGDLLKIYAGNCQHGFASPYQIGSGFLNFSKVLQTGDFDGDRCIDMLAANGSGVMYLYRGDCNGDWLDNGQGTQIGSGWNAYMDVFGPGDFDGDGCNDVIGRNTAWTTLYLWRGNCGNSGGTWWRSGGMPIAIGTGWTIRDKVWSSGDFDGDGCLDVMARNDASTGKIYLYRGNCGNGGVWWRSTGSGTQVGSGFTQTSELIGPGDFNRNQYDTLRCTDLLRKTSTAAVYLYIGSCGPPDWFGNNGQGIATGGNFSGVTLVP